MKVAGTADGAISVQLSQVEYDTIAAALGETLNALETWEFQTRTGVDRDTMRQLLRDFRDHDPDPLPNRRR